MADALRLVRFFREQAAIMYCRVGVHDKAVDCYLSLKDRQQVVRYLGYFTQGDFQALLRSIAGYSQKRAMLLALILLSPAGDYQTLTEAQVQSILHLPLEGKSVLDYLRENAGDGWVASDSDHSDESDDVPGGGEEDDANDDDDEDDNDEDDESADPNCNAMGS